MAPKLRLPALTGIRFFLAFWVLVFHQVGPHGMLGGTMERVPLRLACLMRTGYVAVGCFFVLSGFVLSYNYPLIAAWTRQQALAFARARFVRIYPTYVLGLLLMLPIVAYSATLRLSLPVAAEETWNALLNWTLLQAWLPSAALTWNSPGWSLSNEAFFYLCLPFAGAPLWRLSRFSTILAAAAGVWALALLAPLASVWMPVSGFGDIPATVGPDPALSWAGFLKFNPLLRLPEFLMGVLVARLFLLVQRYHPAWLGRGSMLYMPGLLSGAALLSWSDRIPYPLVHNGLLLPSYACTILGLALGGGVLSRLLSIRPLVFLGNASYAMYILHAPVSSWMDISSRRLFSVTATGCWAMAAYTTAVIVVSGLVFKMVEEPAVRAWKRNPRAGWKEEGPQTVDRRSPRAREAPDLL